MKKLIKLKTRTGTRYFINLEKEGFLERLKQNKYLIFQYQKNEEKWAWKFLKTEKIVAMEKLGDNIIITTNMEGKAFIVKDEFYITTEFSIAKLECDVKNGVRSEAMIQEEKDIEKMKKKQEQAKRRAECRKLMMSMNPNSSYIHGLNKKKINKNTKKEGK